MKPIVYLVRFVAVLAVAVLAAPFVWEKVTGDYFMVVTGVSMEPTYLIGDVLIVKEPTGRDLDAVGEPVVVAFTPGDRNTQYVHRIQESTPGGAILKGDNNDVADPNTVTEAQVMGTPRTVLAGTAAKTYHLTQSWIVRGALAVLVLIALFIPSRRTPKEAPAEPEAAPAVDGATPRNDPALWR